MKKVLIALCAVALTGVASAQTAGKSAAKKAPAKTAKKVVKAAPKTAKKAVPAKKTKAAPKAAAVTPQQPAAPSAFLTPAAIGAVYQGHMQCQGSTVQVNPIAGNPSQFVLTHGKRTFNMVQVPTTTGTVRLEDKAQGVTWLQLGNKSMLMDQRQGSRLADGCQDAGQRARDAELAKNPVNLF